MMRSMRFDWMHRVAAKSALLALGAVLVLLPGAASAQKAMLEKSPTYAIDNVYHSYRVPVQDKTNKIKYYDLTVTLTVGTTGVVSSTAKVVATASPTVTTLVVPPGTYKASDGTVCTVTNINLVGGRVESTFSCALNTTKTDFAVATGTVSSGHPYLSTLLARKVDQLPEVATKAWGVVKSNVPNRIASCGSFSTGSYNSSIGLTTNGSIVSVALYNGSPTSYNCGITLTKQ